MSSPRDSGRAAVPSPTSSTIPLSASPAPSSSGRRSFVFPIRSVYREGRGSDPDVRGPHYRGATSVVPSGTTSSAFSSPPSGGSFTSPPTFGAQLPDALCVDPDCTLTHGGSGVASPLSLPAQHTASSSPSVHAAAQLHTSSSSPSAHGQQATVLSAPVTADVRPMLSRDLTEIVASNEGSPELVNPFTRIVRLADTASNRSEETSDDQSFTEESRPGPPPRQREESGGAPDSFLQWKRSGTGATHAAVQDFVNGQALISQMADPNEDDSSQDLFARQHNPFRHKPSPQGLEESDSPWTAVSVTEASSQPGEEESERLGQFTTRFKHVQIDGGHFVAVGRKGDILRCEDEPITTPGAVQGFGVLIVLDVNDQTGALVVRQVSENSTELLGLSPQYLFGLSCFSKILVADEEETLRDALETLEDPDDFADMQEFQGPQVLRLSGFGQPGSDDAGRGQANITGSQLRRQWTCWVAASRPKQKDWRRTDKRGMQLPPPHLVILEFELERDNYNPLTQPLDFSENSATWFATSSDSLQTSANRSESNPSPKQEAQSHFRPPAVSRQLSKDASSGDLASVSADSRQWASTGSAGGSRPNSPDGHDMEPPLEAILDSTTNHAKPLRALHAMRHGPGSSGQGQQRAHGIFRPNRRPASSRSSAHRSDALDVFTVQAQINEQLDKAADLDTFLKVAVGLIQDLTRFHRVLVYQFDKEMNGEVVTELVEWGKTTDLYKGLRFPAADIPQQARETYKINKVRFLYDRSQQTARLVLRNKDDLEHPLDMTHCFLRAMSPIHIRYLANMKVRSSMSVSIMAFGQLWGLIMCHSYGQHGMRVSFPVRQMLRVLSDQISRGVERLSYAQRLKNRQPLQSLASLASLDRNPHNWLGDDKSDSSKGYIVSSADQLLALFDADAGLLVINKGCKLLGHSQQAHSMLEAAEYLRVAKYTNIRSSDHLSKDFPDIKLPTTPDAIAGMLYIPLTEDAGQDFIVLFRKGWIHEIKWAGRPYKDEHAPLSASLEPRKSFRTWIETVTGKSKPWTDDQLESASVLSLVYGKFIHVWRERQHSMMSNQLTAILLSNTSHAVRTPLSQIINTLELALAGNIDGDTRDMLENSHQASRALLFHVHDLLDLTRVETGNETAFNDPFDLKQTIISTVRLYQTETIRRGIEFRVTVSDDLPPIVVGDSRKMRTVIANLVANAVEYTSHGMIEVACHLAPQQDVDPAVSKPDKRTEVAIEIVVSDTGIGIPPAKLEKIFVTLEGAEDGTEGGVGLGLAVVARIVEQLSGQLRAESEVGTGSKFFFTVKMGVHDESAVPALPRPLSALAQGRKPPGGVAGKLQLLDAVPSGSTGRSSGSTVSPTLRPKSLASRLSSGPGTTSESSRSTEKVRSPNQSPRQTPRHSTADRGQTPLAIPAMSPPLPIRVPPPATPTRSTVGAKGQPILRILVVEDDIINSQILQRRLRMDKHTVVAVENGQEAVTLLAKDWDIDVVLMDIQMPIMDGWEAAREIRALEERAVAGSGQEGIDPLRIDGRIPIFAVSASLLENDRNKMATHFDGWLLKPLNFPRVRTLLAGLLDGEKRNAEVYRSGSWEKGGYLRAAPGAPAPP